MSAWWQLRQLPAPPYLPTRAGRRFSPLLPPSSLPLPLEVALTQVPPLLLWVVAVKQALQQLPWRMAVPLAPLTASSELKAGPVRLHWRQQALSYWFAAD